MRMEPMLESYNDNSALQRTTQAVGNPLLARLAVRHLERRPRGASPTVRIVDYGCSAGRNSVEPIHRIAATMLTGAPELQFECVLEDLPGNPWHQVVGEAARLVELLDDRVRLLCAPTSFFQPVCADGSVDLGFSYVAAHFLDATPPLASHLLMHEAAPGERRAWEAQAARDWERFLALRARELRPGGAIMLSTMSRDGDGYSWHDPAHLLWETIREAARPGGLARHEVEALCVPACLRSEAELIAPFVGDAPLGALLDLDVLHFARTEVEGERDLPPARLAPLIRRRVESVWGGVFLMQLERRGRDAAAARAVMAEVWDRFEAAVAKEPARGWLDMRSYYLQLTRRPNAG